MLSLTFLQHLYLLGALDDDGVITDLGHRMIAFPLAPALARALIASAACSREIATIAALLSVEDIYVRPRGQRHAEDADRARAALADVSGDHLTLLHVYRLWKANGFDAGWARDRFLHHRALKQARNVRRQLRDLLKKQVREHSILLM